MLAFAILFGWSAPAAAQQEAPEGQFFPAQGVPDDKGFVVSDEGGIPFLRTFRRLGGTDVLGQPISQRFDWHGFTYQLTERAMLQWDPNAKQARLANTTEFFSAAGLDDLLYQKWAVPQPAAILEEGKSREVEKGLRLSWLDAEPAFKATYRKATGPEELYGLPTSHPVDVGGVRVMRLQRGILFRPLGDPAGEVQVAATGKMLVEAGLVPVEATTPQPKPTPPPRASAQSSRGTSRPAAVSSGPSLVGVATWYGAYFHGRVMRNGEVYNMWDPTTLASNSHPLGTVVRVTNRNTGASIVARVTDTGAFKYPIVVDLSRAGFARLANNNVGVIPVTVEVVR